LLNRSTASILTRTRLESAKPNKEVTVLVKPENDQSAEPIKATGKLVGSEFRVEVVTVQGRQVHTWTWEFLRDALATYRN
jgi:hypothetical protein